MPQKAKISGFSIPRLASGEKPEGELTPKPLDSRDAKELLDEISRKIHDHKYYSEWQPEGEVQFVHARALELAFREKKASMKSEAPAGTKEVQETIAFALASDAEAKVISSKGLSCGNGTTNALGNKSMGVYLFRCIDVALRVAAYKLGNKAQVTLIAFKLALGKVKPVTLRAPHDESLEPTPMFDCHVSQARPALHEKFVNVIPKTMVYAYEFDDDCLPVQRPRQCLPFAIMSFSWKPPSVPPPPPAFLAPAPLINAAPPAAAPLPPPAALLAAKGSPQPPGSSTPTSSGAILSPPLSSPDRTTPVLDPTRIGAHSMPRRGILKSQPFLPPSFSPGVPRSSASSASLASPIGDDAQFSPNQDTEDPSRASEPPLRGPTIIPKYAPDHPKYKPWVEQMQKLGYQIEDMSKRYRGSSSRKRRSGSSKSAKVSGSVSSEEEEGKERLQIKEMIMQKVNEMKAEAKTTQPSAVWEKLEKMNTIVPELINGLAASMSSASVGVDAEMLVEDRFCAKLVEIVESLKTNIAASQEKSEAEGVAAESGKEDGNSSGDELTIIESKTPTVLTSVVKDVSVEEFRELDKAIHKHYCFYYATYSRLKEMRKVPEESRKEEMEAIENDIAKIQIEIEFLKHRVSQHKWPSELYVSPKEILLKGEDKRSLRFPISEYQVCKVKEINRYIHKHYKNRAAASASKDNKAVEKIQRDLSRFKKDRELTLTEVNMVPNMSSFSPGYDYDVVIRVRDTIIANGPTNETKELFEKKLHFLEGKVATLKLKKDKEINIVRQPSASAVEIGIAGKAPAEKLKTPEPDMTPEMVDAVVLGSRKGGEERVVGEEVLEDSEKEEEDDGGPKSDKTVESDAIAWASPSLITTSKSNAEEATDATPSTSLSEGRRSAEPKSILKKKTNLSDSSDHLPPPPHDATTTEEEDVEIFDEAPASPDCPSDHDSGFEAPPELEADPATVPPHLPPPPPFPAIHATPPSSSNNFTHFFNRLADSLSEVFTDMNAQPTTTTPLPSNARAAFTSKIAAVIAECGLENLQHLEAMSRLQGIGESGLMNSPLPAETPIRDDDEPPTKKPRENSASPSYDLAATPSSCDLELPPIPPPPPLPMILPTIPLAPKQPVPPPPVIIPVSGDAYDPPSPPFFPVPSSNSAISENSPQYPPSSPRDTDIRGLSNLGDRDDRESDPALQSLDADVDERLPPSVAVVENDITGKPASSPGPSTISIDSSDKDPLNTSQTESIIILSAPASPTNSEDGHPSLVVGETTPVEDVDSDRDVDLRVVEAYSNKRASSHTTTSANRATPTASLVASPRKKSASAAGDVDLRDTAVEIVDMELSSDEEGVLEETTDEGEKRSKDTDQEEGIICLEDDNDDLQIVIDHDDKNSGTSGPLSRETTQPSGSPVALSAPLPVPVQEIASPSSPPVVTIHDDNEKSGESEREEAEEEGEISFDEDGGVIIGLHRGHVKDSFRRIDVGCYQLYRNYEGLYRRHRCFMEKKKMRAPLTLADEKEMEDVELKLADLFFKYKLLKLDFEPSLFAVEGEEYLKASLRLPEEKEKDVRLSMPLGRWQEEELVRLKREIAEVRSKMRELIQLDEFPLNLTNVLVNLKNERAKILGHRDRPLHRFLIPPLEYKPSNAILRRLSQTYPPGDRRKRMIEDELLARVTVEETNITPTTYREFLLLQDNARSVFKKLVSIDDGGRHSFQVDKMFYRHVQLANLKRKYASLCALEEENGKKDIFGREIPRGVPGPLSLKGDEVRNRPMSDWQLDALEAMKSQVEDLRGHWMRLTKIERLEERGAKMIHALESFLHLRRFVISHVVLVPNLPSVLSSDVKEQPEMHLCGLLNDVLAGDESSNMDSIQMYESIMAIITEASDSSSEQGNSHEWRKALEKLSELMFWDEKPENKELFFIKDSGRRHETFYQSSFQPSTLPSRVDNGRGSNDTRREPGLSGRSHGVSSGVDTASHSQKDRSSHEPNMDRVRDSVRGRVGGSLSERGGAGRGGFEGDGPELSHRGGVPVVGRGSSVIGKASQPPRLLDLKIVKPADRRFSSSDDEHLEPRPFELGGSANRLTTGRNGVEPVFPSRRSSSPPRHVDANQRRGDRLSMDSNHSMESLRDGRFSGGQDVIDLGDARDSRLNDRSRLGSDSSTSSSSPGDRGQAGRGILGTFREPMGMRDNTPSPQIASIHENLIRAGNLAMNNIRMAMMGQNRFAGGRGLLGEGPRLGVPMGPMMNNGNVNPRDGFGMRLPGNHGFRMPNGGFRGIRRF